MKAWLHKFWYGIFYWWFRLTMFPLYRIRVFGKDHVPAEGPVLIAGNHQSFLDPIFCQIPVGRPMHFLSRDTLYDHWFFGPFIRTLNTIPIRRGQSDIAAMRAVIDKLRQGHAIVIFPESTRSEDGRIGEIKAGFALLARRSGATIVPTIVDGAYEAWPRHQKYPRLGHVGVLYGNPILPEKVVEMGDREFARWLTAEYRRLQAECRSQMGRTPYEYPSEDAASVATANPNPA